jgi:pimeloyl-ACP methyl ester carboxylesterase
VIAALHGLASRPDMLDSLCAVRCPTLIVVGSEDAATTPDDARDLHAVIQGSSLVVLEGAGHMSNWEAADAFNEALRSFLDRTFGK